MADTFLVIGTGPTVNIVLSGAGTPYTAGTGIAISGANVISNTAPDQTVTMTDGAGIDVTGTYPNFTVTNSSPNIVQTLSIDGSDLTLSDGGGTVAIPNNDLWTDAGTFTYLTSTSDNLLLGATTELNSNYKAQIAGAATYRNAAFTTNEAVSGFVDIRGGTMTALAASTHTLAGLNIEGTMVFNAGNQRFSGLRINVATNATASQYITPLDISYSASSTGSAVILNAGTGGTDVVLGGNNGLEKLTMRTPLGGTGGTVMPGISLQSAAGNFSWNIGGSAAQITGILAFSLNSSGTAPNAFDPSLFIRDARTFVGRYPANFTPAATLHVRGEGATSSTFTAQFHNSAGNNNALTVRNDGMVGFGTASQSSTVDINGATGYTQLRLRTSYTPTSTADALGSTGDTAWDENYFYIKTAAGWKRSALSTF